MENPEDSAFQISSTVRALSSALRGESPSAAGSEAPVVGVSSSSVRGGCPWFKESSAKNLRSRDFIAPSAVLNKLFPEGQVPEEAVQEVMSVQDGGVLPVQSCVRGRAGLQVLVDRPAVFRKVLDEFPRYLRPGRPRAGEGRGVLLNCTALQGAPARPQELTLSHLRALLITDHLAELLRMQGYSVSLSPALEEHSDIITFLHQLGVDWPTVPAGCSNREREAELWEALRSSVYTEREERETGMERREERQTGRGTREGEEEAQAVKEAGGGREVSRETERETRGEGAEEAGGGREVSRETERETRVEGAEEAGGGREVSRETERESRGEGAEEAGGEARKQSGSAAQVRVDLGRLVKERGLLGFDPNLGSCLVQERCVAHLAELQGALSRCEAGLCTALHVVCCEDEFQLQQTDLLWRIAGLGGKIVQRHLVVGPVTATGLGSRTSASQYLQLRGAQMRDASVMKYGPQVNEEHTDWGGRERVFYFVITVSLSLSLFVPQVTLDLRKESSVSTKGSRSGVFVMYNCARLSTLFQSYQASVQQGLYPEFPEASQLQVAALREEGEWQLLFNYIIPFGELLDQSGQTLRSSTGVRITLGTEAVCKFLVSLSMDFSSYYNRVHILGVSVLQE
ncbi:DALR anticodon-binding domain-containing protein 3-like [Huso huso]|uniref:DALR anticodon-binding domain-containing protein 3-like n=1 Tax=Huso huso TaxID=61971 RepID=A0ABR0YMI1_HUSHU